MTNLKLLMTKIVLLILIRVDHWPVGGVSKLLAESREQAFSPRQTLLTKGLVP